MSLFDCLLITFFNIVVCVTLPKLISVVSTRKPKAVRSLSINSAATTTPEVQLQQTIL